MDTYVISTAYYILGPRRDEINFAVLCVTQRWALDVVVKL